jgi:beta-galactosidase
MLDVIGQNYREREILAAHQQNPARKIIGTENGHDRTVWLALRDNPPYSGQFLWTGVDYLGEARRWPMVGHGSGLLDRTGTPKPLAYQRQSWWSDKPMVRMVRRTGRDVGTEVDPGYGVPAGDRSLQTTFADWSPANPRQGGEDVEVYSNCEQVELFINDKSLGSQALPQDASPRTWMVPFEPGTLRAVATNNGATVATDELKTAGKPSKITLTPDHEKLTTSWDDVSYVKASIADDNGVQVPNAEDLVTFAITGPGEIVAVDNGDNSSHEPFQAKERHAYGGQCFAIVRATGAKGPITLTASAPDRTSASITIPTEVSQPSAQQ